MFGWIRSATQVAMIARSGNMQIAPMTPVKVIRGVAAAHRPLRAAYRR